SSASRAFRRAQRPGTWQVCPRMQHPETRKGHNMTKKQLVEAMAGAAGISQADADKALGGLIEAITGTVAGGDKVTVPGLGTFEKRDRAARTGRNPATGEEM